MRFLLAFLLLAAPVQAQPWSASLHGRGFALYTTQNSERGGSSLAAISWLGGSMSAAGLSASAMLSLDPLTLGDCGYPRLLSGAGLCAEHPFQDRGHRHALFMDLSAGLQRSLGPLELQLRGGLAGEPALGATGYMHRASAALDPVMPLTHHDINPVHVVNGFATAGLNWGAATLEGSAFNTESDNDPYDFDLGSLDSYSARLHYRFGQNLNAQFSAGRLQLAAGGVHAGHASAGSDQMTVLTSSIELTRMVGMIMADATVGWSRHRIDQLNADGFLIEGLLQRGRHALMLRAETLERIELEVDHSTDEHTVHPIVTRVSELAGVYALRLVESRGAQVSLGTRAALTLIPEFSQPYYGTARARSLAVYLALAPAARHRH